ncbi:lanthionine synthetase LanC family protein [Pseudoalteromonas sp. MMG022]|uniref:lanthionine synthetase LanC family protein n=1 Tax=Pseudoalteromonas sp. MMG022 TaxID=2909978 RepID=UPI001F492DCA|nr:lanthionine synthetase LanC family protein [Pseudoalteromonas sp. MMG022]MCF6435457.1 hypothetical protein [Pseudoalteromonas sp. MMG022]
MMQGIAHSYQQGEQQTDLTRGLQSLLFSIENQVTNISYDDERSSLTNGLASKILFISNLNDIYPSEQRQSLIDELMVRLFEQAATEELNASLADGITGLGWLLDHLNLNTLDDHNSDIDACLLEILSEDTWDGEYELLYGLVGFGVYAVKRAHTSNGMQICHAVLAKLTQLLCVDEDAVYWHTQVNSAFFRADLGHFQTDLGIAHGNVGIIGLLLKFYHANINSHLCFDLLTKAVSYLQRQVLNDQQSSVLPSHAGKDSSSLLGWCYGDLSTALILVRAAKELNLSELMVFGESIALKTLSRTSKTEHVKDASLCHGVSGIALIYRRLYQLTRRQAFLDASQNWSGELIQRSRTACGLRGLMPKHKVSDEPFDGRGLLVGYSGIGLAIMSLLHPQASGWDEFLLLS